MSWTVYMHENQANGKKYIGITSQTVKRRWNNGNGYDNNSYFGRAIIKYGWDSFKHIVLQTGLIKAEAEELEIELISKYKTQDSKYGYNLASGGGVNKGFKFSQEARENLSNIRKKQWENGDFKKRMSETRGGHAVSEETKEKIKRACMEKWNDMDFREKMSNAKKERCQDDEFREKMSSIIKKMWENPEYIDKISGSNNYNARSVVCVETGKVYGCIKDAFKDTGINNFNISAVCSGRRNVAGGYHWKYAEAVNASA